MKSYLCKTFWKEWDEFLETHVNETKTRIICAKSKSEAEDNFIQHLIDRFEKKENPWKAIFAENLTVKQIKP